MSKAVSIKLLPSGVAVLTIDLPGKKLNVLGTEVMEGLGEALTTLESSQGLKGVIVVGKPDSFGAGADVEEIKALQRQTAYKIFEATQAGKALFARLSKLNSIAVINGTCLGGFTELALACRYRVATSDAKTQIGVPEVQLGFIPGWGGTKGLPKLIGLQNAFEMISTGKNLDAKKAYKVGFVDEIVAPTLALARAEEILLKRNPKRANLKKGWKQWALEDTKLGRKLFAKGARAAVMAATKGKYPAPLGALDVVMKSYQLPDDKVGELESRTFAKLATTDISKSLVGLFFAQTESKKAPSNAKPTIDVKTVGIVGAGVMGAGIAQAAAFKGYKVVLKDIDQGALDKGMAVIKDLFNDLVKKRKLDRAAANEMMANIKPTLNYTDMSDCDLVIEAVVESMKVKRIVRADLEKAITKDFVFASNTSSLLIKQMGEGARNESRMVGIHFFNPVHKMPLVEIVRSSSTSDDTVAVAQSFAMKLGKTTVVANDAPSIVVNRILVPMMREAFVLAMEGVPMEDIEKAARDFGMPMGPFTLCDEVGLDIAAHVTRSLHGSLGDRMIPPAVLNDFEKSKLLGKKGGKGIFLYDDKGERKVNIQSSGWGPFKKTRKLPVYNPEVLEMLAKYSKPNKKSADEIQDRLFLIMIAEAARVLEEGVIESASQLDLAMVFGCGFPPFKGGVLRLADTEGLPLVVQKLDYLARVRGENYKPCKLLLEKAASGSNFRQD